MTVAATIDSTLAAAISGISSALGYHESSETVKKYTLDQEEDSKVVEYLMVDLADGTRAVRRWAVFSTPRDEPHGSADLRMRTLDVSVHGYYDLGIEGAGAKLLRDHIQRVMDAILDLGIRWGGVIDRVAGVTSPVIEKRGGVSPGPGTIIEASWTYTVEKRAPGYPA